MKRFFKKLYQSLRKRSRLLIGQRFFVKKIGGLTYLMDIKTLADRRLDAWGVYEKEQIDFFFDHSQKIQSKAFFDIGGHLGFYSLQAIHCDVFETVDIFEPDSVNISQLHANLFLNGFCDRLTLHSLALSNESREGYFQRSDESNRGRGFLSEAGDQKVIMKRFDDLFQNQNHISSFKIDVEGGEIAVIEGMKNYLKNNPCFLQIESYPDQAEALHQLMTSLGYEFVCTIDVDHYFCAGSLKTHF